MPGPVFVVTGPSGAGKGTLVRALLGRFPELELAISATTREQRPGERNGVEYWFLTDDEFRQKIDAGDFLEHVEFAGHRYGTLRSEIDRIRGKGRVPVLELEIEGALLVREELGGAIAIFVSAPLEALETRLRARATESSGEIEERLAIARRQLEHEDDFDEVVHNDDLATAVEAIAAVVERGLAGRVYHARP
ncbi:MAG TPA: guanylate kinase [Gaiellaceae bacterium]|nr:guanylate kinase [Gaiellaceae bacterium]